MDLRIGKINVIVSIIFKFITTIFALYVKRMLVLICGNEINGLNSLYLSIIGILSCAELGIGSAITFCMYKPIVEKDELKIISLYNFFKKSYTSIGLLILFAGISIMPFLKYFVLDYTSLNVNLYLSYILMLISVVITYFFSYKTALFNAYKNNYVTTLITQIGVIFQYILQIFTLMITESFVYYLICRIVAVLFQWGITNVVTEKKYGSIILKKQKLDSQTKNEVNRSIKAMFMHKIGYTLVNTVDNTIISSFVGVMALGAYSNYSLILTSMISVISLLFTSLTSVIGHLCATSEKTVSKSYFEAFHLYNFSIGIVFFLGYYSVIDAIISLLFSSELIISKNLTVIITLNGFVRFMRQSTLLFKDATGMFYYDRWKPIVEGIFNLALSLIFVQIWGTIGVILATIMTNLFICHIIEPYVIYKYAFIDSPKRFFVKNYLMIFIFICSLFLLDIVMVDIINPIYTLIVNGCISILVSIFVISIIFLLLNKEFKDFFRILKKGG